ncbi:MAG: hypothetical protein WCT46_04280 [Candidatus Gracilibacteria bacterium]
MSETPKKTITVEEPANRNGIPTITDEMREAVNTLQQSGRYKNLGEDAILRANSGNGDDKNWVIGMMTFECDGKTWQESFDQLLRKLRDEDEMAEDTSQPAKHDAWQPPEVSPIPERTLDTGKPKWSFRKWLSKLKP